MNDIKVKNRRVNKKKALIMILLGITILGVINRTWAYVDEQIKIKAEQERLAEEKRKAEEEAKNTVFDAEDKAKKEAQSIAKDGEVNVASLKEKAMANVDDAASIIVKNVL